MTGATCPRDGTVIAAPALPERSLPVIPGVVLGEVLGWGGQALVIAGRRGELDVAVKLSLDGSPDRLLREAAALDRIGPPHTPRVHDRGADYLVLERLTQDSLARAIDELSADPLAIARAVFRALAHVHACGVVHGDLSPENLFYAGGVITLIDFGLARETAVRAHTTDLGAGTLHYMAPELLRGQPATPASDVYSAGVVIYELLAGIPPFVGDPATVAHGIALLVPPPLRGAPPWLLATLEKDPARRPTAAEILAQSESSMTAASSAIVARSTGATSATATSAASTPTAGVTSAVRASDASSSVVASPSGAVVAVRESVVILGVLGAPVPLVDRTVTAARGFIARQRGPRAFAVFSGRDCDAPLAAALATASTLLEAGARCAVHVAALELTRKAKPPHRATGAALDDVDPWWPAGDERLTITPDAAALLAAEQLDVPLIGRVDIVERASAAQGRVRSTGRPAVITVLGDRGTGKTRLARELVRRLGETVRVVAIDRASSPGALSAALDRELTDGPLARRGERVGIRASALVTDGPSITSDRGVPSSGELGSGRDPLAIDDRRPSGERIAATSPLAIVIDDGHRVDPAVLAALDSVLLGDRAICVVMIADRELLEAHRGWAIGVADASELVLGPLDEAAGIELARAVIDDEFCPRELLVHLHASSRGHPRTLVEAARLARGGATGSTPGVSEPRAIADDWLVTRALDRLPVEVARFVGVLAIAGGAITPAELDEVARACAGDQPRVDVGAALALLAAKGLARPARNPDDSALRPAGDEPLELQPVALARVAAEVGQRDRGWELQPVALARVAADRVAPPLRQAIHRSVRALLDRRDGDRAERARHALAAGDVDAAIELELALLDDARDGHRTLEAERHATAVLAIAAAGDPRRPLVAIARASMRYRRHELAAALADLDDARRAEDPIVRALADLEAGIVHDWGHDFRASWECAERARGIDEPTIARGVLLAEARRAFRNQQLDAAVPLFRAVIADANAPVGGASLRERALARSHAETTLIAKLLLAPTLAWTGVLDEAEALFADVIASCEAAGDRIHAAVALANRSFLWNARKQPDAQLADLARCIELARELGNPLLERVPAWNLAEMLYWSGRDDEARRYQRRSAELAARFDHGHMPEDALLECRLAIATGDPATARARLAWIDENCDPTEFQPVVRLLRDAIRAVVARAEPAVWDALTSDAEQLPEDERIEIWFLRSLVYPADAAAIDHLRALARRWPIWDTRVAKL